MGMRDLPDMYAQGLRAADPRAEGIHIGQIMSAMSQVLCITSRTLKITQTHSWLLCLFI